MPKTSLCLLFLLQITTLHAGLYLNDQKTLDVPIPKRGLTRLSVQDDLIQDIFVYPQMSEGVLLQDSLQLHKAGHVFLAPEGLVSPFYLTVMTQKGVVQDLKIIPGTSGNGPVILMAPLAEADPQELRQQHRNRLESALRAALEGLNPPGFVRASCHGQTQTSSRDIQKICTETYVNKPYRIEIHTLDNKGEREIALSPALFLGPSDLAVIFDQASLRPGRQVRMALLRKDTTPSPKALKPFSSTQPHQPKG